MGPLAHAQPGPVAAHQALLGVESIIVVFLFFGTATLCTVHATAQKAEINAGPSRRGQRNAQPGSKGQVVKKSNGCQCCEGTKLGNIPLRRATGVSF